MSKFKAGDRVRNVRDNWRGVKLDSIYTVHYVRCADTDEECLTFAELLTDHPGHARYSHRYELVTPTNSYSVHNESFHSVNCGAFFTIAEATAWIQENGTAGETYTVQERIERRRFEVVEKVQRELKAI